VPHPKRARRWEKEAVVVTGRSLPANAAAAAFSIWTP